MAERHCFIRRKTFRKWKAGLGFVITVLGCDATPLRVQTLEAQHSPCKPAGSQNQNNNGAKNVSTLITFILRNCNFWAIVGGTIGRRTAKIFEAQRSDTLKSPRFWVTSMVGGLGCGLWKLGFDISKPGSALPKPGFDLCPTFFHKTVFELKNQRGNS